MSIALASGRRGSGRIAAQIVTGIGFLGAGAILRHRDGVHGLTTAATVWVNAALGVAAGGGEYHLAMIGGGDHACGAAAIRRGRDRTRQSSRSAMTSRAIRGEDRDLSVLTLRVRRYGRSAAADAAARHRQRRLPGLRSTRW